MPITVTILTVQLADSETVNMNNKKRVWAGRGGGGIRTRGEGGREKTCRDVGLETTSTPVTTETVQQAPHVSNC